MRTAFFGKLLSTAGNDSGRRVPRSIRTSGKKLPAFMEIEMTGISRKRSLAC
jgi:hypothetical protein